MEKKKKKNPLQVIIPSWQNLNSDLQVSGEQYFQFELLKMIII